MRRLWIALAVAVVMPVMAADGGRNSLDPLKGRFHVRHTQKLKMDCGTCHAAEAKDTLNARNARVASTTPGPVDRHTCLGCHNKPAKPGWYGGASK
jgi:cytochrome c553